MPIDNLLDFRIGSLVLSALIAVVIFVAWLIARRLNGSAPYSIKVGFLGLLLFALLRIYSASSFLWGDWAVEAGVFPLLRAFVFVTLTLILIISLAMLTFYWRRLHRPRE